ncbi:MAG TPA: prefoldin subunit alpha [Methanomicrobiales archaeon]|nr:prefoldin subunit alpha [Methanomicrobiales archaeon]
MAEPEADLQTLQYYLNEYSQQAEIFSRQLEMIEQKRIESLAAIETMKALVADRDAPTLLPLGGGTMVRVKVGDPEKVLVNVGSDVIVQRTNGEAITFLQEKITEMEAMEKKVAQTIDQLRAQMSGVARQIESAYAAQERPQG